MNEEIPVKNETPPDPRELLSRGRQQIAALRDESGSWEDAYYSLMRAESALGIPADYVVARLMQFYAIQDKVEKTGVDIEKIIDGLESFAADVDTMIKHSEEPPEPYGQGF